MNFLKIFLAVVFVVSFPIEKKSAQSFSFAGTQYLKRRLRVDFPLFSLITSPKTSKPMTGSLWLMAYESGGISYIFSQNN